MLLISVLIPPTSSALHGYPAVHKADPQRVHAHDEGPYMPPSSPVLGGAAASAIQKLVGELQYYPQAAPAAPTTRGNSPQQPCQHVNLPKQQLAAAGGNSSNFKMNGFNTQQQLHSSFNNSSNINTSFISSTSTSTTTNNVSDRKFSLDYLSSSAATTNNIELSPNPRFAQDYPIFTPPIKPHYEEVALGAGSTPPPDTSSKSGDSLEALRDEEDWLSPLVLDDAALPHALDFQFPLYPPATSASTARLAANHQPPPGTASATTLLHRPKIEPRPYHITSIHPNRGPTLAPKRKPRIRSAEFSRHATYPDWSSNNNPPPHVPSFSHKKPLSELLTAKLKHNPTHPSAISSTSHHHSHLPDTNNDINNVNPNNIPHQQYLLHDPPSASSDNGCMQSCDKCLPGSRMTVVPIMDSCDYTDIPPKERDFIDPGVTPPPTSKPKGTNNPFISWFRSKKKPVPTQASNYVSLKGSRSQGNKGRVTPNQALMESILIEKERANIKEKLMNLEEGKDTLEMEVNNMKQEVSQANEKRDAALVEVFELRMAMEEMGKKIEGLESYCQSLHNVTNKRNPLKHYNIIGGPGYGDPMNVEMIEDEHDQMLRAALAVPSANPFAGPNKKEFYHAVTEARVGVKQFCRTLLQQVQEQAATEKIESILQPYNVKVAPRVSKVVRYHLESLVNEAFYEDFENIKFQKSGTNCVLDPCQRPQAFYKTYLGMSQMGWSELVSKESAVYSQSFDAYCDHKMNRVEQVLNWEGRWPDDLARSFFVAAKWVWLLHLLAFSFHHPALIFRVGCEAHFDSQFMEELPLDPQSSKLPKLSSSLESSSSLHLKAMVMPGFFFNNYEVIKCKVILSRQQAITTN
ncbi:hypothetical protein GOP47_0017526 [Adiantum capillus-veneris]|uniref:Uncharacterized protein n=1 Tax=Adiantum capillus-veneris TaxID=13818 RepID=A0A9D4Z993_ADICA|nr:hypothetical protein GOP47_0017526 [Adiantum capillus-veneris]